MWLMNSKQRGLVLPKFRSDINLTLPKLSVGTHYSFIVNQKTKSYKLIKQKFFVNKSFLTVGSSKRLIGQSMLNLFSKIWLRPKPSLFFQLSIAFVLKKIRTKLPEISCTSERAFFGFFFSFNLNRCFPQKNMTPFQKSIATEIRKNLPEISFTGRIYLILL